MNGKSIGSCLGDLYSVNWMQNTEDLGVKQTLQEQYLIVKNLTDKSHVMQVRTNHKASHNSVQMPQLDQRSSWIRLFARDTHLTSSLLSSSLVVSSTAI